eukprot:2561910-Ditylum_brightwellii.AAC.1
MKGLTFTKTTKKKASQDNYKKQQNLRQARSNSFKNRQTMQYTEAIKKAAGQENKTKQTIKTRKILNRLQQKEQREGLFRKMRAHMNKGNSLSLMHVDIPDENELWQWMMPI